MLQLRLMLKDEVKERPDLQWIKGKADLKARSNTDKLPICERKSKESSAPRKKQQKNT